MLILHLTDIPLICISASELMHKLISDQQINKLKLNTILSTNLSYGMPLFQIICTQ